MAETKPIHAWGWPVWANIIMAVVNLGLLAWDVAIGTPLVVVSAFCALFSGWVAQRTLTVRREIRRMQIAAQREDDQS